MNGHVSREWLDRFGQFVATRVGLDFPANRRRDLERGLLAAAREFGFDDAEACVRWLTTAPPGQPEIEMLARHLTVGETYFFRETPLFEALEQQILPTLIASRRGMDQRLRLWSAGCASGEEPYSLAILLTRLLPDREAWNTTILATDINPQALAKAVAGRYGPWSFRGVPDAVKRHHFRQSKEGPLEVLPRIRKMVSFGYHNLVEDNYPSVANNTNAMDVIVCCNVLMYFTPEARARVVERFYRSLVEGGWLIVSSSEANPEFFPGLEPVARTDATLFRRPRAERPAPAPEPWRPLPPSRPPAPTPPPSSATGPPLPVRTGLTEPTPYEEAVALFEHGRYQAAIERLLPMTEPRARALLARAYANTGALEEALGWCEKAISGDKVNAVYRYLQGAILLELNREAEAVSAMQRALYLEPDFILAHVGLAHLLQRSGKQQAARRHAQSALALLQSSARDAAVPHAEGLTAGRLEASLRVMWPEAEA